MFVHHEDVRRANGGGPRVFDPAMDHALWDNVKSGAWVLCRRLRGCGLDLRNASTGESFHARRGKDPVRVTGEPGELLLYVFGRQGVADVSSTGRRAPWTSSEPRTLAYNQPVAQPLPFGRQAAV